MSFPAILLGVVVACLIGAFYHLWRGGGPGRIAFFLALALVGFFGGTFLASLKGWVLWQLGQIDVGFGILGSLIALGLGDWLTLLNIREA